MYNSNMFPGFTPHDGANGGLSHAEAFRKVDLVNRAGEFANFENIGRREARLSVLLASMTSGATSRNAVGVIVCDGTVLEVSRVTARWVIALVSDDSRNVPTGKMEGDPVGEDDQVVCNEPPVTLWATEGFPLPTLAWLTDIDSRPKPCDNLLIHGVNSCGSGLGRVVATRGLPDLPHIERVVA